MAKISMKKQGFNDERIIERVECHGVKYNTKISKPENCDVVIVSNEALHRLKNLEESILNPKKKRFWQRNKKDPSEYIVFFMDSAYHDASWGGNVLYVDKKDGKRKRVNIRATFAFKIYRADRTMLLLSETKEKYSKRYLIDKLRLKVDNTIKAHIGRELEENGLVGTQNNLLDVADAIQDKLNADVLSTFGVTVMNLNMILEELKDASSDDEIGE
jgi:hypothetical protein